MTEVDWGSEANEAPKAKKRVPTWAWFCGGGCLLAIVVGLALTVFTVRQVSKMADPDEQWEQLGQYVPFDERPGGMILGIKIPFQEVRTFTLPLPDDGAQVAFIIAEGREGEKLREQYFDVERTIDLGPMLGNMGRHDAEESVLEVQGRALRCIRFTSHKRDASKPESEPTEDPADAAEQRSRNPMRKSSLALDLSAEGSSTMILMQYDLIGTNTRVEDAAVVEFLRPFRIGPNR